MKLPVVSAKQVVKVLLNEGFVLASQKGSHIKLKKFDLGNNITLIIPNHKVLKKGTFTAIVKQSGLSIKKFEELLE